MVDIIVLFTYGVFFFLREKQLVRICSCYKSEDLDTEKYGVAARYVNAENEENKHRKQGASTSCLSLSFRSFCLACLPLLTLLVFVIL